MGTHPIFESDFDCLTEKMTISALEENVFHHHEKKVLLEAELIISSDDLDEEYEMLQKKYGKEIDNIEFFMYIKRRVNAAYNKTRVFTHRLTHALMGRHCP